MPQQTPKPSPLKNKNIPTFFQQPGKADGKQQKAEAGKGSTGESDNPMKADIQTIARKLDTLEMGLLAKFADLLQPISASLEQLNINLPKSHRCGGGSQRTGHEKPGRH